MRHLHGFPSQPRSRRGVHVLLLAALGLLLVVAPCLAQAPAASAHPVLTAQDASFLASLSADPGACASKAQPAAVPVAAATGAGCTSSTQCPRGQLCCLACGFFGCTATACFPPMNGHCPLFP
jgi:hypothetical protein